MRGPLGFKRRLKSAFGVGSINSTSATNIFTSVATMFTNYKSTFTSLRA
jgi:hypothetical protein